jgi:hypothetical protein
MEIHPPNDIDTKASVVGDSRSGLLQLGMDHLVYLKARMRDGNLLFVLYGADGTPIEVTDDLDAAIDIAAEQGLSFVTVH